MLLAYLNVNQHVILPPFNRCRLDWTHYFTMLASFLSVKEHVTLPPVSQSLPPYLIGSLSIKMLTYLSWPHCQINTLADLTVRPTYQLNSLSDLHISWTHCQSTCQLTLPQSTCQLTSLSSNMSAYFPQCMENLTDCSSKLGMKSFSCSSPRFSIAASTNSLGFWSVHAETSPRIASRSK